MSPLEFHVLGPLQVRRAGEEVELVSAKQRAVLTALILHANRVLSTDTLIEAVWGGTPPSTANHAVHVHVSALRKRLEPERASEQPPEVLITRAPGYLLRMGPGQLDSDRFENLAAEARTHLASDSPRTATDLLRMGLALWRGPALSDLPGSAVADREAGRLEELRTAAVEDRVEADLALGHHSQLVAETSALVAAHPFRERAWAQLMVALYRSGRQGEALERYRALRRLLHDELGVEPAPAVQKLHQLILGQRPELDWTARGTGSVTSARSRVDLPETRYVQHAGVNLAYQVLGQGAVDLVFLPGYFSHLEVRWEQPRLASLYRRLASSVRLVMVDRRGTGLSDRAATLPTPGQQIDDVAAVMHAVGTRRAIIFGVSDGGVLSVLFAAARPDLVAGVVTYAAYPTFTGDQDPTLGYSAEFLNMLRQGAGHNFVLDLPLLELAVSVMAPNWVDDEDFVAWLGRYNRLSAGPGATAATFTALRGLDIRDILPTLAVPTLVLHRADDRVIPPANGHYLAEHIPDARYVELAGNDHILWAGDVDAIAQEIEGFLADLGLIAAPSGRAGPLRGMGRSG